MEDGLPVRGHPFESTDPLLLRDLAPKLIDLAKKVSRKRGRIGKGMDDGWNSLLSAFVNHSAMFESAAMYIYIYIREYLTYKCREL